MSKHKQEQRGVVILASRSVENLLPWWQKHFRKYSSLPVALFDLGLSEEGRIFGASFATLYPMKTSLDFISPRKDVDPNKRKYWESHWSKDLWEKRNAWFAKPFILMESPFKETLLIDLDCRIQKDPSPLFDYLSHPSGFTIVKHQFREGFYHNSGVCGAKRGSPIPWLWAQECLARSHEHMGDEDAIHRLIIEEKLDLSFFPLAYNHPYLFAGGEKAIIQHFLGLKGKEKILLDL